VFAPWATETLHVSTPDARLVTSIANTSVPCAPCTLLEANVANPRPVTAPLVQVQQTEDDSAGNTGDKLGHEMLPFQLEG